MAERAAPWDLTWTRESERYFERLQPKTQARVLKAFRTLGDDPYSSPHVKRLRGEMEGLSRYRLGDLRIVFRILPAERQIRIIAIGSRGDVY